MKLSMRKLLVNASVTLISLLLAFAVCEAVVRTLYKDETVLFPRYHTDYRYGRYLIRGIRPNSTFRHTSVDIRKATRRGRTPRFRPCSSDSSPIAGSRPKC